MWGEILNKPTSVYSLNKCLFFFIRKINLFYLIKILTNAKGKAPLSVIKFDERLRDINVRLKRNA